MAFAGLWERWSEKREGSKIESCTIIVTDANELLRPIHDRIPVILDPADYDKWLDPEIPGARSLLQPCPNGWLKAYPVSRRVNRPQNDDPKCIEPLEQSGAMS